MKTKLAYIVLAGLISSCANAPQKHSEIKYSTKSPEISNDANLSQSKLLDLYEPGAGVPRSGGGVEIQRRLLASFYPEPAISEKSTLVTNCSNSSALSVLGNIDQSKVDLVSFHKIMDFGASVYKKRKVWEANFKKNSDAERSVLSSRGYNNFNNPVESKSRNNNSEYVNNQGTLNSGAITKKILENFGLKNDPKSKVDSNRATMYQALFQSIAKNNEILKAQNIELSKLEKDYVEQLSQFYFEILNKFTSVHPMDASLSTLNAFSKFRQDNVYQCINSRVGPTTTWPQVLIDDFNQTPTSSFFNYAENIISQLSPQIIQKLNATQSSEELKSTYFQMFEGQDLRNIVEKNPKIVEVFSQRSNKLIAEEKRKHEAYQKMQAEEEKRKEKAKVAALQKKIKNNLAPTKEDILPLVISKSMDLTSKTLNVERTSNNSYALYFDIFGKKIYRGNVSININDVKCKLIGNENSCEFSIASTWVNVELLGAIVLPPNVSKDKYSATFQWNNFGLSSTDISAPYIGIVYSNSGGGGSGSNSYDDTDARQRRDDFNQESKNYSNYMIQKSINNGFGGPYDSGNQY